MLWTPFLLSQGYDPLAKEKFVPKYKKKGRSSAGAVERRKKQVAHEDQRVCNPALSLVKVHCIIRSLWLISLNLFNPQDEIRKTIEDKIKMEKERNETEKQKVALHGRKSALDRFNK